jgi:hypothetical protein
MASVESRNGNELDEEDQEVDEYNMQDKDMDSFSDNSSSMCLSKGSTTLKLSKIERKIQRTDLTKRERRLLQNRKSALKCRLKKQDQMERLRGQVEKLSQDNRSFKEKVSIASFPKLA